MDNLVGVPHKEGLEILKQELYERIKRFALLNEKKAVIYQGDIRMIYFDDNAVLTCTYVIPKDEAIKGFNHWMRLLSDDGKIITDIELENPIVWAKGIGGEQIIKLTISGEAGEIVFKKDEYITPTEANELFLRPLVANTNLNITLQLKHMENEEKTLLRQMIPYDTSLDIDMGAHGSTYGWKPNIPANSLIFGAIYLSTLDSDDTDHFNLSIGTVISNVNTWGSSGSKIPPFGNTEITHMGDAQGIKTGRYGVWVPAIFRNDHTGKIHLTVRGNNAGVAVTIRVNGYIGVKV